MSELQHECIAPLEYNDGVWWLCLRGGIEFPVTYCPHCGEKLALPGRGPIVPMNALDMTIKAADVRTLIKGGTRWKR